MNPYEELLDTAHAEGLIVKEMPLHSSDGRINGNRIAIRKNIDTTIEKACVLTEELGHYYTTVGNILDMNVSENRKQERQARLWGYNRVIGLFGLIRAYEAGCRKNFEMAEYLDATEEYLKEALLCYKSKYGICTAVDNYIIYFEPFAVMKMIAVE